MLALIYYSRLSCCDSDGDDLHIVEISSEVVIGRYINSLNTGILFNSTNLSLRVSNLYGEPLLHIYEALGNFQWIQIKGSMFIQVRINRNGKNFQDYFVPKHMYKESNDNRVPVITSNNVNVLKFMSSFYHHKNLEVSIDKLIADPSTLYIKKAVNFLQYHMHISGKKFPSVLPLYLTAHMLRLLQHVSTYRSKLFSYSSELESNDCFDECPPCPDEECLSLCGYGCYCWKWVCGDCCYHLGCYGHDVCCRENFVQTKCLFPIGFKCESEYEC